MLRSLWTINSQLNIWVMKYFLGIEVATSPEGLSLNHRKHVLDILKDVGLSIMQHPFLKKLS